MLLFNRTASSLPQVMPRDYVRKVDRHDVSATTDGSDNQKTCEKAHSHALRFITDYVQKHIIEDCCVERKVSELFAVSFSRCL